MRYMTSCATESDSQHSPAATSQWWCVLEGLWVDWISGRVGVHSEHKGIYNYHPGTRC